ncbi:hypothetical protein [Patulibacter sp.]|uniref:hypothetical protein n=1 Tax=Patulibacter sp. TaxID=1912859 RepID=UPI002715A40B|nr:hypothetical protein [Patulibacter sp.]MDO9410208.1 hypothetical protein [Patulibacter sp.]
MVQDDIPDDPMAAVLAYADWMTEDVAQRLYAARQDLADAADRAPDDAVEIDAVRDRLMDIVRSLHEIAGVLRGSAGGGLPVARIEELAGRVERHCLDAETLMARGLSLIDRQCEVVRALPVRRAVRGDGPFARPGGAESSPIRRSTAG